jgi:hypothetical protein
METIVSQQNKNISLVTVTEQRPDEAAEDLHNLLQPF